MSAIATPTSTTPATWSDDAVAIAAATDVSRRHGSGDAAVDALRGVSLALRQGEFVAVMGPSGSGKSTLMHIMAGLDKPTSGSAAIDGIALERLKERELTKLRRDRVGFVFQAYNLLPTLSARREHRSPASSCRSQGGRELDRRAARHGRPRRPRRAPALRALGRPAAARRRGTRPGDRPAIVFADEPTGNLDSRASADVLGLLRSAADERGQAIAMVTHDAVAAAIGRPRRLPRRRRNRRRRAAPRRGRDPRPHEGAGMNRLALRGIASRKLRTVLTALAIVFGTAMVCATLVLTSTAQRGF